MPNFQPVTKTRHGNQRWLRYSSYAFAQRDGILPLSLAELPKATMTLVIAFVEQKDGFNPVALMGLHPDKNMYLTPDGRWVHGYIPTTCRSYPFRFMNTPDGQQILCVDEDSGLMSDGPEGEAFFDEAGSPGTALHEILQLLSQNEQSMKITVAACAVLNKHHLIQPWPITIKLDAGEKQIQGLFCIDEAALNQLAAEDLFEVRNAGGLLIAYSQLLSMQHLGFLGQLAEAHAREASRQATEASAVEEKGELNLDFLKGNGPLNLSGFR